jgi:hypothetical protein
MSNTGTLAMLIDCRGIVLDKLLFCSSVFFCCDRLRHERWILLIRLKGNLFQETDNFLLPRRSEQLQLTASKETEVISNHYSATTNLSPSRTLENHLV